MKCPFCNEKIPGFKRLCPRNISYSDAKQGVPREYLKIQKEVGSVAKDIDTWLFKQPYNSFFTHNDILKALNLEGKTYGDKIQRVLGSLVCLGLVVRKKHSVKEKLNITETGNQHIYQKQLEFEQKKCQYLEKTEISKGKYIGFHKIKCLLESGEFNIIFLGEE